MRFIWGGQKFTDEEKTSKDLEERHRLRKPAPSRKHTERRGKRPQQKRTRVKIHDSDLVSSDKDLSMENRVAFLLVSKLAAATDEAQRSAVNKLQADLKAMLDEAKCDKLTNEVEQVLRDVVGTTIRLASNDLKTALIQTFTTIKDNGGDMQELQEAVNQLVSRIPDEDDELIKHRGRIPKENVLYEFIKPSIPPVNTPPHHILLRPAQISTISDALSEAISAPPSTNQPAPALQPAGSQTQPVVPQGPSAPATQPSSQPQPQPPAATAPAPSTPSAADFDVDLTRPEGVAQDVFRNLTQGMEFDKNDIFSLDSLRSFLGIRLSPHVSTSLRTLQKGQESVITVSGISFKINNSSVSNLTKVINYISTHLTDLIKTAKANADKVAPQNVYPAPNRIDPESFKHFGQGRSQAISGNKSKIDRLKTLAAEKGALTRPEIMSTTEVRVADYFTDVELLQLMAVMGNRVTLNSKEIDGDPTKTVDFLLSLLIAYDKILGEARPDSFPISPSPDLIYARFDIEPPSTGKKKPSQKGKSKEKTPLEKAKSAIESIKSQAGATITRLGLTSSLTTIEDIIDGVEEEFTQPGRPTLESCGKRLGVVLALVKYIESTRDIPKAIRSAILHADSKKLPEILSEMVLKPSAQDLKQGLRFDEEALERFAVVNGLLNMIRQDYKVNNAKLAEVANSAYSSISEMVKRFSVLEKIDDAFNDYIKQFQKSSEKYTPQVLSESEAMQNILKLSEQFRNQTVVDQQEYKWDDVIEEMKKFYRTHFKDDESLPGWLKSRTASFSSSYKPRLTKMNHLSTYHGVLVQRTPDESGPKWTSIDKRYLNDTHYKSIISCAKEFLKGDWISHSWEGGGVDSKFRAALDLAIATADGCMYQSKIDAPTYNVLLDKLQSLGNDMMVDTLLPYKVAASDHKTYINTGNERISAITREESSMENQELGTLIRVAFNNPEARPSLLPIIAAKMKAAKKKGQKPKKGGVPPQFVKNMKKKEEGSGESSGESAPKAKASSKKTRKASIDVTFDDARW